MLHASRYNVTTENTGETLLYNTASGAFAALDEEARRAYRAYAHDCEGLPGAEGSRPDAGTAPLDADTAASDAGANRPEAAPARRDDGADRPDAGNDPAAPLVTQMRAAGFLTEATPDEELAAVRARFEEARRDPSQMMLGFAPTYACNYRCPYCYEQGMHEESDVMGPEVMDAVLAFAEKRFDERPYQKLLVEWYGGDPSLALPQVEELSERLIAFCDEHGIAYDAFILTNGNLIDDDAAAMLARNRVRYAMLTIDGFEQTHNVRRVPADDANSYERVINAAELFLAHGIGVQAIMNVDRVNWPEYRPLRDHLRETLGIELTRGRLSDCGRFFGTRGFCKPTFDLFDPAEFARLDHNEFIAEGAGKEQIRARLAPIPLFCNAQSDNNYLIGPEGDVYVCDGYLGHADHVVFNLLETPDPLPDQLRALSHNPFESAQCSACDLLPVCLGNCTWERETERMQCHPLKYTLPAYLRDLRACYDAPTRGFTLLTEPNAQSEQ